MDPGFRRDDGWFKVYRNMERPSRGCKKCASHSRKGEAKTFCWRINKLPL